MSKSEMKRIAIMKGESATDFEALFKLASVKAEQALRENEALRAKVERYEKFISTVPQIVFETLLEATAFMGIPEKRRTRFIKERMGNIQFIIHRVLEEK